MSRSNHMEPNKDDCDWMGRSNFRAIGHKEKHQV
jgi:hypothetical protein